MHQQDSRSTMSTAASSSSTATSMSTSEARKFEDVFVAPPVPDKYDTFMKEHNTLEGVQAGFEWWAALTGERLDYEKIEPIFRNYRELLYNGGLSFKTTDVCSEVALKKNSDCCCRISHVAQHPSEESLADFAFRKGYYSNPEGGPYNELFTLMEKAFRLTTCAPCFTCVDIHASLGLVKLYVHFDQTPHWLDKHLGMPKDYLQLETLLNPDPSKHEIVTIVGFDFLNNTMNTYITFKNPDKEVLFDTFRKAATLCGAEVGLPEDITYVTQGEILDTVLTYSFTTHQFVRVGTYCVYDIDAPNIDESGATPYVANIFEKCKERLGSLGWAKNPIKGLLPFSNFIVGHTYSRGGKHYVKGDPVQKVAVDLAWKFWGMAQD